MQYTELELVAMYLGCSILDSEEKNKLEKIVEYSLELPHLKGADYDETEESIWDKIAQLHQFKHYLNGPLEMIKFKDSWLRKKLVEDQGIEQLSDVHKKQLRLIEKDIEIKEIERLKEIGLCRNLAKGVLKLLLDDLIPNNSLIQKLSFGPIKPRLETCNSATLDIRSRLLNYGLGLTSHQVCIYKVSIGDYFYIGSTYSPAQRLYWHHKKIYEEVFEGIKHSSYKNLEKAVSEFGPNMAFEIIKDCKKIYTMEDLVFEEQIHLNSIKDSPKALNSGFVAFRRYKNGSNGL